MTTAAYITDEDRAEAAEWGRRAGRSGIRTSPYAPGDELRRVWDDARMLAQLSAAQEHANRMGYN